MIKRTVRLLFRYFSRIRRYIRSSITYELQETFEGIAEVVLKFCQGVIPILALAAFASLIYDVGFNYFYSYNVLLYRAWRWFLFALEGLLIIRLALEFKLLKRWRSRLFNLGIIVLVHFLNNAIVDVMHLTPSPAEASYLPKKLFLYVGTIFLFITEVSHVLGFIYRRSVNPAFLFVISFFLLIGGGALLLMLPHATTKGISPVDALFTSASAVCVTGLIVVDTATAFTTVGKIIILVLIQIGGLGIMTFAGLLSYLSVGSVSFANQLALKDMLSSNRISNVIGLVVRVIIVTIFFEIIGAVLIHSSLDDDLFRTSGEKLFFSVFHTVSAFCNAGFSTYANGLYELPVRFNYTLHLIVAILVILGGMGFPIVFNIFTYIRIKAMNIFFRIFNIPRKESFTHILHASSKLALATSAILLITGFITYLLMEQNATLREHSTVWGKIVTSIFATVTPRTAGFNTVDMSLLTLPTIMIYLLLMLIGASPGGTGGGIKTTVAAVAFLNMKSIILGKDRTEVFRTQISENSINRAFAIIILSLLVLGVTTLLLSIQQKEQSLLLIAFEAFSAFSTVGLSLGITSELTTFSKIVLSIVMLVGRVGTLTLLFAFVSPAKRIYYRYPTEEVLL